MNPKQSGKYSKSPDRNTPSVLGGFFCRTIAIRIVDAIVLILTMLSTPAIAAQDAVSPVVSATARLESVVEKIPLSGSAFPWKESSLSTQVDGLVVEVLVDDGDRVKKGQLLVRLDNTIANLNTRQAKSAMDEAETAYAEAVRQRDDAKSLVGKRHIAKTAYESLIAESKMKRAVRERLKAEYRRASELADQYRILAPFDGIVGTVAVEVGQWVESGDAVVRLFDIDTLKIRVPVPQRYFASVEPGTPVTVRFDALPDQSFEANVSRKIPIGTQDARTFPVRIDFPNPTHRIAPGMSAKVLFQIDGSHARKGVTIPRDALVSAPDGSESVWKINRTDAGFTVSKVAVQTGRFFDESVEITSGSINPGDSVVVRGNEILKSGQRVELTADPQD